MTALCDARATLCPRGRSDEPVEELAQLTASMSACVCATRADLAERIEQVPMTPYDEALDWVRHHPEAPEALGLAKLILSLHHPAYAFSFRECTDGMRDARMALSLRVVGQFVRIGREDESMLAAACTVAEWYPVLTRRAEQMEEAKQAIEALAESEGEVDQRRADDPEIA